MIVHNQQYFQAQFFSRMKYVPLGDFLQSILGGGYVETSATDNSNIKDNYTRN